MGPAKTYRTCGYQRITSLASSTALTIPSVDAQGNPCKPNAIIVQCETQNVRWLDTGAAPTATSGMLLLTGQQPFYYDGDLLRLRFIEAAASAALNVLYVEDVGVT